MRNRASKNEWTNISKKANAVCRKMNGQHFEKLQNAVWRSKNRTDKHFEKQTNAVWRKIESMDKPLEKQTHVVLGLRKTNSLTNISKKKQMQFEEK